MAILCNFLVTKLGSSKVVKTLSLPRSVLFSNLLPSLRLISTRNMGKKALLLVADGTEEMEAVITADVLRRGEIDVTVAGINGSQPVKCSREVTLVPDTSLEEAQKKEYDIVVMPGGMGGSNAFAASAVVGQLLKKQESSGKKVAAICAAPIALKSHGIGLGKKVTCYPGIDKELKDSYQFCEDKVVVDGNLITSRGPGTAFDFGLAIVENLVGKEKAKSVAGELLLKA